MEQDPPTTTELLAAIIDLKNATEYGLISLEARMNARFEQVDHRFEDFEYRMNRRFDRVDERFDELGGP